MTRLCLVLLASLILFSFGCSDKPWTLTEKFDKKEMAQAIEAARSTFDDFLERCNNPRPGDRAFSVKVKIKDNKNVEHFWVTDVNLQSEPFSGKIGNEPGFVKNVKLGQEYHFRREDISDWMYMSNGKMEGNYTLRVILKSMPKDKADLLSKKFGFEEPK